MIPMGKEMRFRVVAGIPDVVMSRCFGPFVLYRSLLMRVLFPTLVHPIMYTSLPFLSFSSFLKFLVRKKHFRKLRYLSKNVDTLSVLAGKEVDAPHVLQVQIGDRASQPCLHL